MSTATKENQKSKISWQRVELKEVCEQIDYGYTASSVEEPIGPKFLRITDIIPELIDWEEVPYCEIEAEKYENNKLEEGDIVIARTGANTGHGKFISTKKRAVFASYLIRIRPNQNVNDRFIGYIVESEDYKRFIEKHRGGSAQPNANAQVLTSYKFQLPPIKTQNKIAEILSSFDDLIENNKRRIKILEDMAEAIYKEWFVNFNFPGSEDVEMKDSDLGPIPENFEAKEIGEVTNSISGGTPKTDKDELWENGDITWFTPSDLTDAGTMFMDDSGRQINEKGLDNSGAKMFPPYSVMMTSRATLGVLAINTTSASTNQGFINVIPEGNLGTYYIYHWLQDNMEDIISLAGGATYKELRITVFREIKIPVPPKKLVDQFESKLSPIGQEIENLIKRNKILRQTRDLLLPKLISGGIEI